MIINLVVNAYLRRMALRGKSLSTILVVSNLGCGQARDKHGGVDKSLFSPLLNPLLTPSPDNICIKLHSARIE